MNGFFLKIACINICKITENLWLFIYAFLESRVNQDCNDNNYYNDRVNNDCPPHTWENVNDFHNYGENLSNQRMIYTELSKSHHSAKQQNEGMIRENSLMFIWFYNLKNFIMQRKNDLEISLILF